jgi:hypothetical protein
VLPQDTDLIDARHTVFDEEPIAIYLAHAAPAEQGGDFVDAETGAGSETRE